MNGFYPAVAGALAQDRKLEILTANLANVDTPGFKKSEPVFQTVLAGELAQSTGAVADFSRSAVLPLASDAMPWVASTVIDLSPGNIRRTGNPFDLAINGDGFFAVQTPQGEQYTRGGDFTRNSQGQLSTENGYPVLGKGGPIQLGQGNITVSPDGEVTAGGNTLGTLKVVTFKDPRLLVRGESGLLRLTSGTPQAAPEQTEVRQGYLEGSNVNVVDELSSMITTLRVFQSYEKVIQSQDNATARVMDTGRI